MMRKTILRMLALVLVMSVMLAVPVAAQEDVVIVLDPGHGGMDSGASVEYDGEEVWESVLCLKIAEYCRDYLQEHYQNVQVHLTRETDERVSLEKRVELAKELDADFLLSIHLNSDEGYAEGALALVPRGRYNPEQGKASKEAAEAILAELEGLGLNNLGTVVQLGTNRYPDGTYVDSFAIIRGCVRANIPGIILEQAFLDNENDYENYLNSEEKLAQLGRADALGLAAALGLEELDEPDAVEPETMPFVDVAQGDWYYEAVEYVWERGLMQGISATEFAPALGANRAMVVTLLYRMAQAELEPEDCSFTDVEPGSWYHAPVEWALEQGITNGVSATEFAPGRNVIREQFVTFLHRFAGEPEPAAMPEQIPDWDSVSGYAGAAMAWAIEEGLITGYDDGTVKPLRELNRAELAVLMHRFHRWYFPEEELPESEWTLAQTERSLRVGESFELELVDQYGQAAEPEWYADCEGVVEIEGNTVTAVGAGTALVCCEWAGEIYECLVEVEEDADVWTISHEDVTIRVGESFYLKLRNQDGETAQVAWSAGQSGYVSISGNKITGKARGTVTVSCEYEGQRYACVVRVKNA